MKTSMNVRRLLGQTSILGAVVMMSGCSAEIADEAEAGDLASRTEAIGEPSCATVAPTQSFDEEMSFLSPRTYSAPGCFKAVVLDITNLSLSSGGTVAVFAQWADTLPTTQAACENLWLGGYTYVKIDGLWEKAELESVHGTWSGGTCAGPSATFDTGLSTQGIEPGSYRFVVGARTAQTGGAATRAISVFNGIIPH